MQQSVRARSNIRIAMTRINSLPNSQVLLWDARTSADGSTQHTAPVSQKPLASALRGETAPSSLWGRLTQRRTSSAGSLAPRQKVDANLFASLKRLEKHEQAVAELVPFAPNNVPSIVASMGESVLRYEMADRNFDPNGQYTIAQAEQVAVSGSGVCSHTNNVLFRSLAAAEAERAQEQQRLRSSNTAAAFPFRPTPVLLAINQMPQTFVFFGDPRESDRIATGDSWQGLPIVKSWDNTAYKDVPYSIKAQAFGAAGASVGVSLERFTELAAERPRREDVDAHATATSQPVIGSALLAAILKSYTEKQARLADFVTSAADPARAYEGPDGEVFTPSIDLRAYQRQRSAQQQPAGDAFRTLVGPNDFLPPR
jgi:hypothetical protein